MTTLRRALFCLLILAFTVSAAVLVYFAARVALDAINMAGF